MGDGLLWRHLRTSNENASAVKCEALAKIVPASRKRFPTAKIQTVDSGCLHGAPGKCCVHGVLRRAGNRKDTVSGIEVLCTLNVSGG